MAKLAWTAWIGIAAASACLAGALPDTSWIEAAGGKVTQDQQGHVVAVDLRSSWITDADIPQLSRLPDLRKVDLSLTRISDRGLRGLKSAPGIVDLNLYFVEQITDEGMAAIKGWKHLERLNLRGTKITDETLELLAGIPTLQWLDIGYAQITDSGLNHLTSLTNLREVMIGGNKLTDNALEFVRQMPQLTYLDVGGTQRTDSGLWNLQLSGVGLDTILTLPELKELRIAGTTVTARDLRKLQGLAKLERLNVQGCRRLNDEAVAVLSAFSQLRRLDVKGSGITEQGAAQLRKALPKCEVVY